MADFTAFSEGSFSSTDWINKALAGVPEQDSLDSFISSVSTKLHIISQDYTDQLETAMVESMSTIPRILSEITKIESQLRATETEMKNVSLQLSSFDQKNVNSVEDLSRLDVLKLNMEKCKSTLEEHARWSQLTREGKLLIDGDGPLTVTADKVETMFLSMDILRNLPGYEERQATCESYRDALLASVRPNVARDLANADPSQLTEFVYVFRKLGRDVELEAEYVRSRPAGRVTGRWSPPASDRCGEQLASAVSGYLARVSTFLAAERDALDEVFGPSRGPVLLCDMLVGCLQPMHASLLAVLDPTVAATSALPVESVFAIFCSIDEFASRSQPLLQRAGHSHAVAAHAAIFSSLREYMRVYADREEAEMREQLATLASSVRFSDRDESRPEEDVDAVLFDEAGEEDWGQYGAFTDRLLTAADSFHDICECSMRRAVRFMAGARAKAAIKAMLGAVADFATLLAARIEELSVACGIGPGEGSAGGAGSGHSASAEHLAQQQRHGGVEPRILTTAALRAVQAVGRFTAGFDLLVSASRSLLSELLRVLADETAAARATGGLHLSLVGDSSDVSELTIFLRAVAEPAQSGNSDIFSSLTVAPFNRLRSTACGLLLSLTLAVPEKLVAALDADESWADAALAQSAESLLPQAGVTQVGEHMLSLVQDLEAFAASDALADLLPLRGQAAALVLGCAGWQRLKAAMLVDDSAAEHIYRRASCCSALVVVSKSLFPELDADRLPQHVEDAEGAPVLVFVNEWLGAVADAALALLLARVAEARALSVGGAAQLRTDLEYLSNVVAAMGLRAHPLLHHTVELLLRRRSHRDISATVEHLLSSASVTNKDVRGLLQFDRLLLAAMQAGDHAQQQ